MTDLAVVTGDLVESRNLVELETSIKGHLATMVRGTLEAFEARIAIGHDLLEARGQLPGDREFGQWCGEHFNWSRQWRLLLMEAAENEAAVRHVLSSQLDGKPVDLNFEKVVRAALPSGSPAPRVNQEAPELPTGTYSTIVVDPPWSYRRNGVQGAVDNQYPTLSQEEIAGLPVDDLAAENAHLYLWVTVPKLWDRPTPAEIVEGWGFTYKTLLTWVKGEKVGIGWHYRVDTEHVLFCNRGSAPIPPALRESNVLWAPRTRHSAKPEAFMDRVEQVSPGPFLEMFARRNRVGWETWGDECLEHVEVNK